MRFDRGSFGGPALWRCSPFHCRPAAARTMVLGMSRSSEEIAAVTHDVFNRHPRVRLALLFGSVARGTANTRSDIDIAVSAPGAELSALASQLSLALGQEVDAVSLDADPPVALLRELLRDGRVLYEAEHGAEAALRARALWTVETDGPAIDAMARRYLSQLASRASS